MENNSDIKRGGCLTAFLSVFIVIMVLNAVGNIFRNSIPLLSSSTSKTPQWVLIILSILYIIIVIGCVLIFIWKKYGVYLFAGAYIVITIINTIVVANATTLTTVSALVGLAVVLGILFFLIKPIWKHLK